MTRTPSLPAAIFSACLFLLLSPTDAAAGQPAAPSPSPSASPTAAPLDALAWRNIGPAIAGGRLAAIAGSDRDPALVYIGAAGGGVWKSTNGTISWHPVFDKQDVGSIGAIAVNPSDPEDVWIGTGESNPRNDVSYGDGLYRSTDGGKTWTHLGLENTYAISKIALDPRDPNVAVVAALGDPFQDADDRGIYRTVDGGKTWTKTLALGAGSGGADLDRSAKQPNVLFASMWQFRRSSWHLESGGERDGLFKSTDGGATWKRVSGNGFAEGITGRIGVAVAANDPNRVYAIVESTAGLLWRSDDGGTHWKMISTNTLIDERPFYYTRIFVDPHDENHLFATSVKLAESKNGGETWQLSGKHLHGDHHAVWFSADGRRVLEGNDGGAAISNDNGATWQWRNNVPIGQLYRVATDARTPYDVCGGLQDNGSWCGPNDSRSDAGVLMTDWNKVAGGDGNWTIPDPVDPDWIWASSGGGDNEGELTRYNVRTRLALDVSPYLRNQNVVAPTRLAYRFNWEAPLAFSPFDGHVAYYGGNVVFRTTDAGVHWQPMSPDLTRNIKARQGLSGTPLRLDVTGAETYDTILSIVPSTVANGELWVTTDDGKIQITRDGGAHWHDATPKAADMDARVPILEASHRDPATAYAILDRHFTGDRAAYVEVTHDFGRSWTSIAKGLPVGQFARAICEDPGDPAVLILGLENSVWWSGDGGTSWRSLQQNLPPVSVRDLRFASNGRDLVAGTHGRGIWILDDAVSLEHAKTGAFSTGLQAPSKAYQYEDATPTIPVSPGDGPPGLALFTFMLSSPAKAPPTLDVTDIEGHVVRHFAGTHEVDDADVPVVSNVAGFNRVSWDLTGDPPVPWYREPKWDRGPENGTDLLPGPYVLRLHVDGKTYVRPITIAPDPRAHQTNAQRIAHVTYVAALYSTLSRIDTALNQLDNIELQMPDRIAALAKTTAPPSVVSDAKAALAEAHAEAYALSSHPVNDQDNDFLEDLVRERIQSLIGVVTTLSPTAEQGRESAAVRGDAEHLLAVNASFMNGAFASLQKRFSDLGIAPIDLAAKPVKPAKKDPLEDEHAQRRSADD